MIKRNLIIIVSSVFVLIIINFLILIYFNTSDSEDFLVVLLPNQTLTSKSVQDLFLVTKIVDGDTIDIETGERIRLICIDTPERGEDGFEEAKKFLEVFILNKKVNLTKDISDKDRFGRILRYIYLEKGIFVNEEIAKRGLGVAYWYEPDISLCNLIQSAENYAKENDLGIWESDEKSEKNEEPLEENQTEEEPVEPQENVDEECECSSNKYNCEDFLTHQEAQKLFECCLKKTGKDIHTLDKDKDGVACEGLR